MKNIFRLVFGLTLCAQFALGQSALQNPASSIWDDADFVKSFTASYGVLSPYEPEVTDAERDVLRRLLNVIKSDPRAAIIELEQEIETKSSAAFDFILANLYFQEGDLNNAAQAYRKALRKYPNFRRAHKNLGLVLVQDGKLSAAIPALSKALELGDVDGRSYGLLGYSYLTEQLYYPAEAAYRQAILMQPKVRDWKLGLARCLVETENFKGAIALFDTLIKQEPDNADFWLLQANAYIGLNNNSAAAQNLEVVRRMSKADSRSLTMLGDIYMNQSHPELALSAYLSALKQSGVNSQALMRSAKLFTQTGNFAEAKALIAQIREQVSQLSEANQLSLMTLEAKIARSEGDEDAAFTILKQIVERDVLNGDALIELGNYYAEHDDFERAVNRYEQAQMINDFERPALIAHAQALIRKKNYQEALLRLNRALELKADRYLADYVERIERAAK
ncbi:tetratricopeptide repeat protein [Coraliomargarita sp. W4R53]